MIDYKMGNQLNLDEVIELYQASTLGERRPLQDRDRIRRMLENANLVLTAWDGEVLVGMARSISDFAYCTYVSDLVVRKSHQLSANTSRGSRSNAHPAGRTEGRRLLSPYRNGKT